MIRAERSNESHKADHGYTWVMKCLLLVVTLDFPKTADLVASSWFDIRLITTKLTRATTTLKMIFGATAQIIIDY